MNYYVPSLTDISEESQLPSSRQSALGSGFIKERQPLGRFRAAVRKIRLFNNVTAALNSIVEVQSLIGSDKSAINSRRTSMASPAGSPLKQTPVVSLENSESEESEANDCAPYRIAPPKHQETKISLTLSIQDEGGQETEFNEEDFEKLERRSGTIIEYGPSAIGSVPEKGYIRKPGGALLIPPSPEVDVERMKILPDLEEKNFQSDASSVDSLELDEGEVQWRSRVQRSGKGSRPVSAAPSSRSSARSRPMSSRKQRDADIKDELMAASPIQEGSSEYETYQESTESAAESESRERVIRIQQSRSQETRTASARTRLRGSVTITNVAIPAQEAFRHATRRVSIANAATRLSERRTSYTPNEALFRRRKMSKSLSGDQSVSDHGPAVSLKIIKECNLLKVR